MKKFSKKRLIINLIVIAVVLIGTVYYLFKSEIITKESLSLIKPYEVLLVFSAHLIALALWGLYDFFVYQTVSHRFNYLLTFSTSCVGFLGSGVTPLKSGHFPLKAYYHNTRGVSAKRTIYGITKCQLMASVTTVLLYSVIMTIFIFNGKSIVFNGVDVKLWLVVLIGLTFHFLLLVAIIILSLNLKLQSWFIDLLAKIVKKIKKDKIEIEAYKKRKERQFARYRQALKEMIKKPFYYLIPMLTYSVFSIMYGSLQYFSYIVITGDSFAVSTLFYFYVLNLSCAYITNIIPVPGGVGTAEIMFSLVFSHAIGSEIIGSVLVLWRISTYYLPIVVYAIIFFIYLLIYNHKLIKKNAIPEDEEI